MTIFANSRVKARFDAREFGNAILLGNISNDKFCIVSIFNDPNTKSKYTWGTIIQRIPYSDKEYCGTSFGVWKRRFPVLAYGLRLHLNTSLAVIVATAVVNNIAREMNEAEPPLPMNIQENEIDNLIEDGNVHIANDNLGNIHASRNEFVQYFSNL
ncbi:hypothetical protein QE152_g7693 [Popillia japonica]|uniref:Uncharacterized protein n=1 Tax=Popillia japonica TaxID=7064 RepID=A0AAW1MFC7_POPJA